jgi:hypothetical protein
MASQSTDASGSFDPKSGPTVFRINDVLNRRSSGENPVEVLTKWAPARFAQRQASMSSSWVSKQVSKMTFTTAFRQLHKLLQYHALRQPLPRFRCTNGHDHV